MIEAVKQAVAKLEAIHPGSMTPEAHDMLKNVMFTLCTALEKAEKQQEGGAA